MLRLNIHAFISVGFLIGEAFVYRYILSFILFFWLNKNCKALAYWRNYHNTHQTAKRSTVILSILLKGNNRTFVKWKKPVYNGKKRFMAKLRFAGILMEWELLFIILSPHYRNKRCISASGKQTHVISSISYYSRLNTLLLLLLFGLVLSIIHTVA